MSVVKLPEFKLPDENGSIVSSKDLLGKKTLFVFYPGDETLVCTKQLCQYSSGLEEFTKLNVSLIGVSKDSVESHKKFKEKYNLKFPLLSDEKGELIKSFGVDGLFSTKRSVFLINETGEIIFKDIEAISLFYQKKEDLLESIKKYL